MASPRTKFRRAVLLCQGTLVVAALPLLWMSATMFTGPGVPLLAFVLAMLAVCAGFLGYGLAPLFPDE